MGMSAWAAEMARYNQWQNEVMYGLMDGLSAEERNAECGLFFDTMQHTLDHILMVDLRLLELVQSGQSPGVPFEPRKIICENYEDLRVRRREADRELLALAGDHNDRWFEDLLNLTSPLTGELRELPRYFYLVQLFNHGTHHRAQVSSELHRRGIDYGSTDLPMNPYSLY